MKKYVIDTNTLISFVTDRNLEQQQIITPIFESAAQLKSFVLCHQQVLTEFVYVMDKVYNIEKDVIGVMISDFIDMPGIQIIHDVDFKTALTIWPHPVKDFSDAIIASLGKSVKSSEIVTFDKKFINQIKSLGLNVFLF